MKKRVLINPVIRWACEPGHMGTVTYVEGLANAPQPIPHVGDVLTVPFFIDALTGEPCPVRVTRLEYMDHPGQTVVVPVVSRHLPT